MKNDDSIVLKKHVDHYCGSEADGFYKEDTTMTSVAKFIDVPDKGLVTYLTIGLSAHILNQEKSRTRIRQELLVCIDTNYDYLAWEKILFSVASIILKNHNALLLGQVIGPGGLLFPEFPNLKLTSLLCTYPAFFDEEFCEIDHMDDPMVFVELIPISTNEAGYIRKEGWSSFFNKVNSGEINILDLKRDFSLTNMG